MLSSIRKFSTSIYAKILLGIVIIPFVFWGMGSSFKGGNKNIVVKIDKEKFTIQDFANYIQSFGPVDKKLNSQEIDKFLSMFIGNKLIEKEYENLKIKLSDKSLGSLIKNQNEFKKDNIFSRTQYEKFLIESGLSVVGFEVYLAKEEKKKQLLNFIGGGILSPNFLVNDIYNKINQKRYIELINLNDIFKNEFNFSENDISTYYENNKNSFQQIFKTIEILEVTPKILVNSESFNDLFFKKIDEIDNKITEGKNLNYIVQEYNMTKGNIISFNKFGEDLNSKKIATLDANIINQIYSLDESEKTILIESKDKFFVIEIVKTENVQKDLKNESVQKIIVESLKTSIKRKSMAEIISKINEKSFQENDFYKFSKDKNVNVQNITLENINDTKILDSNVVNEVYSKPENKIIILNDISLTKNFLIFIKKIENVSLEEKSDEYIRYKKISENTLKNRLFNTYDNYMKKKYKIDINYSAVDTVKNYFN